MGFCGFRLFVGFGGWLLWVVSLLVWVWMYYCVLIVCGWCSILR